MVLPAFVRINQNVDIEGDYLNIKKECTDRFAMHLITSPDDVIGFFFNPFITSSLHSSFLLSLHGSVGRSTVSAARCPLQ